MEDVFVLLFGVCLFVFQRGGLQEGENVNQLAVWEKSILSRGKRSTRSWGCRIPGVCEGMVRNQCGCDEWAGTQATEWPDQGVLTGHCEHSGFLLWEDRRSLCSSEHLTYFNKITLAAVLKTVSQNKGRSPETCQEVIGAVWVRADSGGEAVRSRWILSTK